MEMNQFIDLDKQLERARRNTLGDILTRTRDRMPNKLALTYKDKQKTYAELDDLVNQTAQGFQERGMEKGDMITVMSKNRLDVVITKFGLARLCAVMIENNYMLSVEDVLYILDHAEVSVFIASEEYASTLDAASGRLNIKHRYIMDTLTVPDKIDSHEEWQTIETVRAGHSTCFFEA